MSTRIESSLDQGVLELTFMSEDGLNTMDDDWLARFETLLRGAADDVAVRAVLLSAQGAMFSAGANMAGLLSSAMNQGFPGSPLDTMTRYLAEFPKPLLAAVHGKAIGGGATLLLHCDLVVAASDTQFRFPFTALGGVPEFASSFLLPRAAGTRLARELLLLGNVFDAHKAMRAGLINDLTAPGEELTLARKWAVQLAALAPAAVQATKRLLHHGQQASMPDVIANEGATLVAALAGGEVKEAMAAFKGKRKPDFSSFH